MTAEVVVSSERLTGTLCDDIMRSFLIMLTAESAFIIDSMKFCSMFNYFVMPSQKDMA